MSDRIAIIEKEVAKINLHFELRLKSLEDLSKKEPSKQTKEEIDLSSQ